MAVLLVSTAARLPGQERTGRVRGRIVSERHDAIAVATIAVSRRDRPPEQTVRSDERGHFLVQGLPPGDYRVQVRALGFREVVVERVTVRLGQMTALGDVLMRTASVVLAPMVITSDASAVDPLSTSVSTTLDVRAAEALPVGRDYTSMLLLLPQVHAASLGQEGLNIAGSTGLENAFYVDGINVTETLRHNGGISLPPTFIDNLELKTGAYEPEFGRGSGGVVSMTTRSGTNVPWQSAFAYYSASGLASTSTRSAFDFATGRFARYDIGVAAAGPIRRERLWYFAAYDAGFAREDVRLPGGPKTDGGRADRFAAKLTWRADPHTNVSATVLGDPSQRDVVGNPMFGFLPVRSLANPEPFLSYWDQGGVATSVAATRTLGSGWLVEGAASRVSFWDRTGPQTAAGVSVPLVIDFETNEWSGGEGNQWNRRSTLWAGSLSASYARGEQTLKLGAQFEDTDQHENWQFPGNGPDGAGVIYRTGSKAYQGITLDLQTQTHLRVPTLYVQTSILAHRRLRLNAGFRWEQQRFSSPTTGQSSAIDPQFQPRLGAIVYPTGSPDQKLVASAGRFYEQVPSQPVTWGWGGLQQRFFFYDHDPRVDPSGGAMVRFDFVPSRDVRGQYYDEFTIGYERTLSRATWLGAHVSHRELREVLELGARTGPPVVELVLGNPGRGEFASLPRPNNRYDALELSLSRFASHDNGFMISYVLSRNRGNYRGVRDQETGNPNAHTLGTSDVTGTSDPTGLLPNDRTHALKAFGSRRVYRGMFLGAAVSAASGTPVTEFGKRTPDPVSQYFLGGRGAAGRTPFTWDANLRTSYTIRGARVAVDVLHAFSQRRPVLVDQFRYLAVDSTGKPMTPNPFYRSGLKFQPPMTLRIGLEVGASTKAGRGTTP